MIFFIKKTTYLQKYFYNFLLKNITTIISFPPILIREITLQYTAQHIKLFYRHVYPNNGLNRYSGPDRATQDHRLSRGPKILARTRERISFVSRHKRKFCRAVRRAARAFRFGPARSGPRASNRVVHIFS